jgi:hypothetical protein
MATTHVAALVIETVDVEEFSAPKAYAQIGTMAREDLLDPYDNDPRQVMVSWFRKDWSMASAWFTRASLAPILFPEEG